MLAAGSGEGDNAAMNAAADLPDPDAVIARTRQWLERAVIGLNLCPFAKAVQVKDRIRYAVSMATTPDALQDDLLTELTLLRDEAEERVETTLLIHPGVLTDFQDYNEFLDVADAAVQVLDLEGVVQVASFHPDYQFADSGADDIENFTNRSPYPILHLLRESSIDRVLEAFPEAETIYETNMETMRRLGHEGWRALWTESPPPASKA